MPLRVTLTTPERLLLDGVEAEAVVAPAFDGEVGILPGHTAFIALLGAGEFRVTSGGTVRRFALDSGFLEVHGDVVTLLTERALAEGESERSPEEESGEKLPKFADETEDPAREKSWEKAKARLREAR